MKMKTILRLVFIVPFLLACFSLAAVAPTQARSDDLYFQKDTLIPGVIIIKNKYGDKVGMLKKDSLIPKKWILQLKDGKEERRFSVNPLDIKHYLNGDKR